MQQSEKGTVKIIIAEDELPLRQSFERELERNWPEATIVASCADGASAIDAVKHLKPDVVFLDIRMPNKSGLEVAKAIGDQAFIVFTTAYDQYAVKAFESGAVDYLLKPIESKRLVGTIERLQQRLETQQPQNLENLISQLQGQLTPQADTIKWVTASAGDSVRMISVDDILYFQSDQKYTKVVTADSEAVIRMSLKELVSRLDGEQFWKVHRSTIVAASAIHAVKRNELGAWRLSLKDRAERLPVSAEFQKRFKAL